MKISKITKILPLALALSICGCAFAEEETPETKSTTAVVNYSITLNDYIRITTTTPNLSSATTFGNDYKYVNISSDMTGSYHVISNAKKRTMELKATDVNGVNPLFDVAFDGNAGTAKIVLAHTTEIPSAASMTNAIGATPAVDSNPNAIAFNVTFGHTYDHGPGSISPAWDGTNKKVVYTMNNGESDITVKIGGKNVDNTFNTQDQSGIYKATLTLTDVGAVTEGGGGTT